MGAIQVFLLDLPTAIKGLTIKNTDDSYTIFVNVNLSYRAQREAYSHEMEHIKNKDFNYIHDVNYLEAIRHDVAM